MHAALFVASLAPQSLEWASFLDGVDEKLGPRKDVLRLAENVWLLDLHNSEDSLDVLTSAAQAQHIEYGVVPFMRTPHWLPHGFDPHHVHVRPHASYCV